MARPSRVTPEQRVQQLQAVIEEKEPLRQFVSSDAWTHVDSILEAMTFRSAQLFRSKKIDEYQHRADLNAVETLRAVILESEVQVPRLMRDVEELEQHRKKKLASRMPGHLPGA